MLTRLKAYLGQKSILRAKNVVRDNNMVTVLCNLHFLIPLKTLCLHKYFVCIIYKIYSLLTHKLRILTTVKHIL